MLNRLWRLVRTDEDRGLHVSPAEPVPASADVAVGPSDVASHRRHLQQQQQVDDDRALAHRLQMALWEEEDAATAATSGAAASIAAPAHPHARPVAAPPVSEPAFEPRRPFYEREHATLFGRPPPASHPSPPPSPSSQAAGQVEADRRIAVGIQLHLWAEDAEAEARAWTIAALGRDGPPQAQVRTGGARLRHDHNTPPGTVHLSGTSDSTDASGGRTVVHSVRHTWEPPMQTPALASVLSPVPAQRSPSLPYVPLTTSPQPSRPSLSSASISSAGASNSSSARGGSQPDVQRSSGEGTSHHSTRSPSRVASLFNAALGFTHEAIRSSQITSVPPGILPNTPSMVAHEELQQSIERLRIVSNGATKEEIDLLPTQVYSPRRSSSSSAQPFNREAEQCPICLTEYEAGNVIKRLPCLHTFCDECINHWLQIERVCPCCKVNIRTVPRL